MGPPILGLGTEESQGQSWSAFAVERENERQPGGNVTKDSQCWWPTGLDWIWALSHLRQAPGVF